MRPQAIYKRRAWRRSKRNASRSATERLRAHQPLDPGIWRVPKGHRPVARRAAQGASRRAREPGRHGALPLFDGYEVDYEAVRHEDGWLKPPGFWGSWSVPAPEYVVERRVEAVTFAEARAYFPDREANLMPDFKIPGP